MSLALRADAERNRGLVLDAARAVFAERGPHAGMAEIAERAGVGVATVFRRFPSKDALLVAILEARVREVADLARTAASFGDFMADAVALHMDDRCLCEMVDGALFERPVLRRARREVRALVRDLLRRAQDGGELRRDLRIDDVPVILLGIARAAPRDGWRRYLDLALDGLRPR